MDIARLSVMAWDVVSFLQHSHLKMVADLGNWNLLADMPIENIPKVFDRWGIWWIQQLVEDQKTILSKEVHAYLGNVQVGIILMGGHMIRVQHKTRQLVSGYHLCSVHVDTDEMQTCFVHHFSSCVYILLSVHELEGKGWTGIQWLQSEISKLPSDHHFLGHFFN